MTQYPLNTHYKTIFPLVSDMSHGHIVCLVAERFNQSINWLELDYVDATLFSRCKLQFVNKQNIGENTQ